MAHRPNVTKVAITKSVAPKTATKEPKETWVNRTLGIIAAKLHVDLKTATGEQVRDWLRTKTRAKPTHHNAYGALIRTAIGRGLLKPTGTYTRMIAKASHGRSTAIYKVIAPKATKAAVAASR